MEILCLYWMGSDRQVDEADDCHYLENAPPVRPQQLLSIFQTGEKLQTTKRSANRRFALAVKKQTSNPSITQFQPESQRCCNNSVTDRAHPELSFGVKTML